MLADRRAASVSNEGLFIAQIGSLLQEVWRKSASVCRKPPPLPRICDPWPRSNPVEEGLVEEPHPYLYSSARDEAEMPGMPNLDSIWEEVMAEPVPPLQGHQSTTNEQGQ